MITEAWERLLMRDWERITEKWKEQENTLIPLPKRKGQQQLFCVNFNLPPQINQLDTHHMLYVKKTAQ